MQDGGQSIFVIKEAFADLRAIYKIYPLFWSSRVFNKNFYRSDKILIKFTDLPPLLLEFAFTNYFANEKIENDGNYNTSVLTENH